MGGSGRNPRLTIASVKPDGVESTACIVTSHPDGLYVTDDFIVTHNSTLAINICVSAAGDDTPVGMFSLEMPEDQIGMVALAKATGISVNRQRRGDVGPEEHRALQEAAL